ncbi:hypothetical protein Taro_009752 [Colocasia esculenta]|uniref:Retrotransposon gag domain-containing protein n=1 Tax=Colocasia esculenta TaxID=4460 RepID=A0A843U136_COLES|nr:hypothetical protein [Colocasia esculenta]
MQNRPGDRAGHLRSRCEESVHSDQELARRLHRVVDLERRVDAMVQRAEGNAPMDEDMDFHSSFTKEILEARVSLKLPLPTIAPYDGTTDPADHIHGFESHMVFHGASDAAKCRAFPATMKDTTRAWFEALPAGSISSFHQLKKSFRNNFLGGRSQPRTTASLLSVRQKKGKALRMSRSGHKRHQPLLWQHCRSLRSLRQAHARMVVAGFDSSPTAVRDLIYCAAVLVPGALGYAHQLFDQILHPDLFTWNTLIRGSAALPF